MSGLVFLQFFSRYVLNDSFAWTEELAVYCLIPVVFIGAAMSVGLPPENVRPLGTTVTSPMTFGVMNLLPVRPCSRSNRSVSFRNASACASAQQANIPTPPRASE